MAQWHLFLAMAVTWAVLWLPSSCGVETPSSAHAPRPSASDAPNATECLEHGCILQLLRPAKDNPLSKTIQPVPGTLAVLKQIKEPVALVAAVGPYHSGKSFLLNVLLNSTLGFNVGTRPDPETLGLWIRILPSNAPRGPSGARVILMDTEGLYGDGGPSRAYDAKIFALATLLSSHVLYNTLRTVGDAQSVTQLADLAKRANMFNLNTWLDSGIEPAKQPLRPGQEATGGDPERGTSSELPQAESTLLPDVALLRQTLEFPPLTWVVQGLDIDLPPDAAPMAYLQYFLEAHATSGDRSLEALFHHGISCYTLRSPSDMNRVRGSTGGKGLGAQEELFGDLDPEFVADVFKLRSHVLDNLLVKAGGNLTGAALAEILPVLAHFASEDFPMLAEKKLPDMMADIFLDQAFAASIEYYHSLVRNALAPRVPASVVAPPPHAASFEVSDGEKVAPGECATKNVCSRGEERPPEDGVGVSQATLCVCGAEDFALAPETASKAEALGSSQEMEEFLVQAVSDSVAYCLRYVAAGIPEGRVNSTCRDKLPGKLYALRQPYREKHQEHVVAVLHAVDADILQRAVDCVNVLKLPMEEHRLACLCDHIKSTALSILASTVAKHCQNASVIKGIRNACADTRTRLEQKMGEWCTAASASNARWVQNVLSSAKEASHLGYRAHMERLAPALVEQGGTSAGTDGDWGRRPSGGGVRYEQGDDGVGMSGDDAQSITGFGSGKAFGAAAQRRGRRRPKAFSLKSLWEIHGNATEAALKAFEGKVQAGGMPWVRLGHMSHDLYLFQLEKWLAEQLQLLQKRNEVLIKAECEEHADSLSHAYITALQRIQPFPDNDEAVVSKAEDAGKHAITNLSLALKDFAGSPSCEACKQQFKSHLETSQKQLQDRNTQQMAILFYKPLAAARRKLRIAQDCTMAKHQLWERGSFWACKCLWPLSGTGWPCGLSREARRRANLEMHEAQLHSLPSQAQDEDEEDELLDAQCLDEPGAQGAGQCSSRGGAGARAAGAATWKLSDKTRIRVVREWINNGLTEEFRIVWFNFAVLLATVALLVVSSLWGVGGPRQLLGWLRWAWAWLSMGRRGLAWLGARLQGRTKPEGPSAHTVHGQGTPQERQAQNGSHHSASAHSPSPTPSTPERSGQNGWAGTPVGATGPSKTPGQGGVRQQQGIPASASPSRFHGLQHPSPSQQQQQQHNLHGRAGLGPAAAESPGGQSAAASPFKAGAANGNLSGSVPPANRGPTVRVSGAYYRSSDGQWRRFNSSPGTH